MLYCFSWCFGGGRPEKEEVKETNKDRNADDDDKAAKLDAEYQQIARGIAARLAEANHAERIRIRDQLRDKNERWFPGEGKEEGEGGEEEEEGGEEEEDDKEGICDPTATGGGPLSAPRLRVMSPMPFHRRSSSSSTTTSIRSPPEPESPMTADLQPVLLDLPDTTKFAASPSSAGSHGGDDSD